MNSHCLDKETLTPSLLVQFILWRWLAVYPDMAKINDPIHSSALPLFLERLTGDRLSDSLPWNSKIGTLSILQESCQQLSSQSGEYGLEAQKLSHFTQKTLYSLRHALFLIRPGSTELFVEGKKALSLSLKQSFHSMNLFRNCLFRFLPHFREDENVLFFLLRHADRFQDPVHFSFLTRLLKKMYPKGLKELGHFLSHRFQKKGFQSLAPLIHSKINSLNLS